MRQVIVFGIEGMIGRYVYQVLKAEAADTLIIRGLRRADYDALNDPAGEALRESLKDIGPDHVVINCIGITPQNHYGGCLVRRMW